MNIEVALKPYKVDDKDLPIGDERRLRFSPTWNTRGQMVDIKTPDGTKYTVSRDHLERALRACAVAD